MYEIGLSIIRYLSKLCLRLAFKAYIIDKLGFITWLYVQLRLIYWTKSKYKLIVTLT